MNTTNIFKQFIKNTVGKFTRIKFTKNGTIRKITGIAAIISIMAVGCSFLRIKDFRTFSHKFNTSKYNSVLTHLSSHLA